MNEIEASYYQLGELHLIGANGPTIGVNEDYLQEWARQAISLLYVIFRSRKSITVHWAERGKAKVSHNQQAPPSKRN